MGVGLTTNSVRVDPERSSTWKFGLNDSGLGQGQVVNSCEHENESWCSI